MATVVVDVGRLYAEREQLQSGADAAALGGRRESACARPRRRATSQTTRGTAGTPAATRPTAQRGDRDLRPGTRAARAARRRPATGPPAWATAPARHVRRGAHDHPAAGRRRPCCRRLRRTLAGGGYEGTEVGACARVAWGSPAQPSGSRVTFSTCEWDDLTDGGARTGRPPARRPASCGADRLPQGQPGQPDLPGRPVRLGRARRLRLAGRPGRHLPAHVEIRRLRSAATRATRVSQPCRTAAGGGAHQPQSS